MMYIIRLNNNQLRVLQHVAAHVFNSLMEIWGYAANVRWGKRTICEHELKELQRTQEALRHVPERLMNAWIAYFLNAFYYKAIFHSKYPNARVLINPAKLYMPIQASLLEGELFGTQFIARVPNRKYTSLCVRGSDGAVSLRVNNSIPPSRLEVLPDDQFGLEVELQEELPLQG